MQKKRKKQQIKQSKGKNQDTLSLSKKNVNVVNKDNELDRNTNEKKFKANCKEDYEKIKIYLFASFKCYFANVMKNGYVFFHDCKNLLASNIQVFKHLDKDSTYKQHHINLNFAQFETLPFGQEHSLHS